MSQQGSWAPVVDRQPLAWLIAMGAAGSLTFHLALYASSMGGDLVFIGWLVAIGITAFLAWIAADSDQDANRTMLTLVLQVVVPGVLVFLGFGGLAYSWLLLGVISASVAMPMVQWCSGSSIAGSKKEATGPFGIIVVTGSTSHPIPGAMVAGILMFAMPTQNPLAWLLAIVYFGCLLMLASLGGMLDRARKAGRFIKVDTDGMGRWLAIVAMLLLLCGVAGISVPVVANLSQRDFHREAHQYGVSPKPTYQGGRWGEAQGGRGQDTAPQPNNDPNANNQQQQPKPDPNGKPSNPQQSQQQPPPKPVDWQDLIMKGLLILIASVVLLWVARKYGSKIIAFLNRVWSVLIGPYVRWRDERARLAAERAHEAKLKVVMQQIGDPFVELPQTPKLEELPAVYRHFLASAHLLGAQPGNGETVAAFARRLQDNYSVDRKLVSIVSQVCSRSIYAPNPPNNEECRAASDAASTIGKKVQGQFTEGMLAEKKRNYWRSLAERELNRDGENSL